MKLPRDLSGAQLAKALARVGYSVTRQTGSHLRASRITRAALRDLLAGRSVKLTREGKTIAALRALPLRPGFDPAAELAAIRKADRGDDWADYLAWRSFG